MSGGRRRSRTGDTYGAMNMRESQTDWTHIADKAATTLNPLYGSRSDKQTDGSDDADKTKCCTIRIKLWITIGIAFAIGVAIVVILAYCAVKGLLVSTGESLEFDRQGGFPGSNGSHEGKGSVGMDDQTGLSGSTGNPEGKGSVGMDGQAGLPGSTGSPEEKGRVGRDGQTGLPGSTGSPEGKSSVGMDGQAGLPGSTGSPEEKGRVGRDGQTGLPGSAGSPEGKGSVGMDGQAGLPGSTGSPEEKGRVGRDGQTGLPGSTGSLEGKGRVGMDGQAGLPGSTGSPKGNRSGSKGHMVLSCGIQWVMLAMGDENGRVGRDGQAGLPGSTGSSEENGPVGMDGQAGLPGSAGTPKGNRSGSKGHMVLSCGIQWVMLAMGDGAKITWSIGPPEENGRVGMDGQDGVIGSTGSMGMAGAAVVAASGLQEQNGPNEGKVRRVLSYTHLHNLEVLVMGNLSPAFLKDLPVLINPSTKSWSGWSAFSMALSSFTAASSRQSCQYAGEASCMYRGTVSVTNTGKTCQRWDSQTPHEHIKTPAAYPSAGLEQNYCRNPDGEPGVWCFTTDPSSRWELCDVPSCISHQYEDGASYRGTVSVTNTGKTCQRWDSQTPHEHSMTPGAYPSAGLERNYCRNPDGELGVWCFTTDPNSRWELCDVPSCLSCQYEDGASYRGTVSVTNTGKTCQRWDSQTPHEHIKTPAAYPSAGLERNYCRNPDGELGVWCFTTDPNSRWELCDVPSCGKTCQRWDSQTPHEHIKTPGAYPSAGLERNYCRNPDGELGVWCFTTDPNSRWELCDVPSCDFCPRGIKVVIYIRALQQSLNNDGGASDFPEHLILLERIRVRWP
ncbi:hypothetical protein Bbelb_359520 [Branchiostoma belcheri]|nr:hypothetical protein Bbelb_359520 [Branchiostoma belcheri]